MGRGETRLGLEHPVEKPDGGRRVAALCGDLVQKVKRLGVRRITRQDLAAGGPGLRGPARRRMFVSGVKTCLRVATLRRSKVGAGFGSDLIVVNRIAGLGAGPGLRIAGLVAFFLGHAAQSRNASLRSRASAASASSHPPSSFWR